MRTYVVKVYGTLWNRGRDMADKRGELYFRTRDAAAHVASELAHDDTNVEVGVRIGEQYTPMYDIWG